MIMLRTYSTMSAQTTNISLRFSSQWCRLSHLSNLHDPPPKDQLLWHPEK